MRYRQLDADGDYMFGHGQADFFINQPEAVAQAVGTRLRLWLAEWFLDTTDGTNWQTGVLGRYTEATRDAILRQRILETPGVNSIISYSTVTDTNTRTFTVHVGLDTIYGPVP